MTVVEVMARPYKMVRRTHRDRFINSKGYALVFAPDHPNAMYHGFVYEHRLVFEKQIGRFLLRSEKLHHKDDNRLNNHPDNLELVSEKDHQRLHAGWKKINGEWWRTCGKCKQFLKVEGNFFRYHNFRVAGMKSRGKAHNEYANLCKPCYAERAKGYRRNGK